MRSLVRKSFLPALAVLVVVAAVARAQTSSSVVIPAADTAPVATVGTPIARSQTTPTTPEPMGTAGSAKTGAAPPIAAGSAADAPAVRFDPERSGGGAFWLRADYLVWWVSKGPTGGPLITTGALTDPVPGGLGNPSTAVVFGDAPMNFGNFSGMRLSAGLPLGSMLSVEGTYFLLERGSVHYGIDSDATGNPLIARPAISADTGGPISYVASLPGLQSGTLAVDAHTRLQGGEVNLAGNVLNATTVRFDVLGGVRALDLAESMQIYEGLSPLTNGILTFNGVGVAPPSTVSLFDSFRTANHFYGGQIGGRLDWQRDGLVVTAVAKLALGVTQQTVTIDGASTLLTPGAAPVVAAGGILAQPTNIGRHNRTAFSVVPEAGLEAGYQIRPWLRATIGFTFLYWNSVARPGSQIDHTVSFAQVPTDPAFGSGSPATHPALPSVRDTDFWAQGINFGLTFRY
jgi:hypothetical protein